VEHGARVLAVWPRDLGFGVDRPYILPARDTPENFEMAAMTRFLIGAVLIGAQLGLVGLSHAAQDQPAPDKSPPGRFAAVPTANGMMRLDSQTGAVSVCVNANGVPECRSGPDERGALEGEIARLSRENAELRAQLAGHRPAASANAPTAPLVTPPSEAEIDRAINIMEKFVQRMMRIIKDESSSDPT